METAVTFESSLFTPYASEDAQIEHKLYGFELAHWLSVEFTKKQVMISYPDADDSSWYLEYTSRDEEIFALRCVNRGGSSSKWRCYLDLTPKGFLKRTLPDPEKASTLINALKMVLAAEPGISNITWSTEPTSPKR